MKNTTRNLNISLSILLCAIILHVLTLVGLAQTANQILSLDGSGDYVSIPSAPDLQNPIEITVEAWIFPTITPSNKFGSFINKGDGDSALSARTYEWRWVSNGIINLSFFLDNVDGTPDEGGAFTVGVPSNTWTHVAATFDGGQGIIRFYTNGMLAAETSSLNGTPITGRRLRQSSLPVVLGWTPFFPDIYASGGMDEVRIWKVARSAQEIYASRFCRLTGTETNLAGYWNFDDGAANDLTGHGHNGTFAGNAQAVTIVGHDAVHAGVCGASRVLWLDGSSGYVTVPSAADLQNPAEFTLEAWLYPQRGSQNNTLFINKSDNASGGTSRSYELGWVANPDSAGPGNSVRFVVFLSKAGYWAFIDAPAASNEWVHVAGRFSSSQGVLQLFTNGISAKMTTDASGLPLTGESMRQTTLPVRFGRGDYAPYFYAHGYMDEVRIWKTARSAQEIYANRFCRLTGTETNLAGYWNFDDETANDLTGHGHNGTFLGTAQAVPIVGSDVVHAGICGAELPPSTATASAVLAYDFVVAANITDGGYGYTNTPTVSIFGGGGSGAQAVAVVSNGVVIAVNVLDAGSGYTNAPIVVIDPPFIPNPVLGIAPMSFLAFSNLTLGGVYQLQRSVAWYWSNQPVSFTATNALYTQMVAGVAGSGDYRLALNPVPAQAFATPQVVNGFLVGATVTSGGSGYVTSPAVNLVGGGGTNATALSHISGGVVTAISITDAGIGYTNAPTIQIAAPPAAAVSPTVRPVMRVDSTNLAPYNNYQIQFKPDLGGTWANWNGGLFSPTGVTHSQYLFITNGVGFFRVSHLR